ncbi:hypothetical protein SAMN02745121_03081 [Nannocystis exedens]|uniref:Uncharacterized protein n=1 Tax=Nannocystis exedens TaxID=54 RepID=A0A1I1Y085_9BACT|nr:hypothetical protein [Nannocystis exedens]PCC71728.1 hypothetical protein NAEX_04807 [Nannocystis exedens]SFE12829.1 hypothetical protein SAMN02745121_03081 [Nannocystis exedens]
MIAWTLLLVVQAPAGASAGPASDAVDASAAPVGASGVSVPASSGAGASAAAPVAESTEPVAPLSATPGAATSASLGEAGPPPVASRSAPSPAAPAAPPRKFVFAWLPSVVAGISPAPSTAPVTVFLGGRLPRTWALGYQLTVSVGLAERYLSGLLAHRHHLTALHGFGADRRGFTSVGGGVSFNLPLLPVVEVEGRIGLRFGETRRWVFGALARLGWDIGHEERAPMPQFGAFFGYAPL